MSREFLINITFLFAINLLIKPFYVLVIEVGVQNEVGPTSYGLYFALFNFSYIFQVLVDVGIQNYNSKTIAQDRSLVTSYIPHIIGLKCILSILFIGTIFLFAIVMGYPSSYFNLLALIVINQVLLSFILYLRTNISALGHYRIDSLFSIIDKLILILIIGYLLWFSGNVASFTIYWFVYCQMASLIVCLIAILLFLHIKVGSMVPKFSIPFSKKLIKQAIPYALIILLMTVYTKVDAVMLERMLVDGKTEAGIYAAAYRLLDAVNMLGYLFAVLLLPMFSHALANNQPVQDLALLGFRLIMLLSISAALFCFYNNVEIMSTLYTESTMYYGTILKIIIFGFIPIGITYITGSLLLANGNIKSLNILFGIGIVFNIALNFIFIPEYKAIAAAYTTVGTQFVVAIGQIYLIYKHCNTKINSSLITSLISYTLIISGILYGLNAYIDLNIWIKLLCFTAIGLLVSFLIKIIDIRQIQKILISDTY